MPKSAVGAELLLLVRCWSFIQFIVRPAPAQWGPGPEKWDRRPSLWPHGPVLLLQRKSVRPRLTSQGNCSFCPVAGWRPGLQHFNPPEQLWRVSVWVARPNPTLMIELTHSRYSQQQYVLQENNVTASKWCVVSSQSKVKKSFGICDLDVAVGDFCDISNRPLFYLVHWFCR